MKVAKRLKVAKEPLSLKKYKEIRKVYEEATTSLREPLPYTIPNAFVTYVVDGINLLRKEGALRKLPLKVGDQSVTLALIQLFTTGFSPKGVEIIERIEFVAKHMYKASMFAQLANVRCRGQTICARQICRILVTATGDGAWRFPKYIKPA